MFSPFGAHVFSRHWSGSGGSFGFAPTDSERAAFPYSALASIGRLSHIEQLAPCVAAVRGAALGRVACDIVASSPPLILMS